MHSLLLTLQMKNGMATVPTLSSVMLYEVEMLQVHIPFYHKKCLRDFKIGKFNKIYNFMASLRLLLIKILPSLLSKYHLAFAKKKKKTIYMDFVSSTQANPVKRVNTILVLVLKW